MKTELTFSLYNTLCTIRHTKQSISNVFPGFKRVWMLKYYT